MSANAVDGIWAKSVNLDAVVAFTKAAAAAATVAADAAAVSAAVAAAATDAAAVSVARAAAAIAVAAVATVASRWSISAFRCRNSLVSDIGELQQVRAILYLFL